MRGKERGERRENVPEDQGVREGKRPRSENGALGSCSLGM